ncbi:hypothetical protein ACWCV9_19645 [Streptomyces sp. NPDC001606]
MSHDHPVRRFLRQDKADTWAVRLLPRIVFGLAAAYTLVALAAQSGSSFITVCTLLVLGAIVWLLRRRGQLLLALGSTVLTAALAGYLSAAGENARGTASSLLTGQTVFGYWALSGMALLGAWMVKEHPGRRGVTVVLADLVLLIASGIGMFAPQTGVPIGFIGLLCVLALRGGTAKALLRRVRRAGPENRSDVRAAERRDR